MRNQEKINKKISKSLKGRIPSSQSILKMKNSLKKHFECNPGHFTNKRHTAITKSKIRYAVLRAAMPSTLLGMSRRTAIKVLRRMNIGCSSCEWNEAACDLHHIKPLKNKGRDSARNITILCPNCHRMVHAGLPIKFISINKQIGNKWKKFYYAR